jgi:hypothetical protein
VAGVTTAKETRKREAFAASIAWRASVLRANQHDRSTGEKSVHVTVSYLTVGFGKLEDWTTAAEVAAIANVSERWARAALRKLRDPEVIGVEFKRGRQGGGIRVFLLPVPEAESDDSPVCVDNSNRNHRGSALDSNSNRNPKASALDALKRNSNRNSNRNPRASDTEKPRDREQESTSYFPAADPAAREQELDEQSHVLTRKHSKRRTGIGSW